MNNIDPEFSPEEYYKDGERSAPEGEDMFAGLRARAAKWEEVAAAGVRVERTETEVIVTGNTFPVRDALKRNRFRWNPNNRCWYFVTKEYYAFVMRCGRLEDAKIRYHPEPMNWIEDVHKALFGE